MTIMTTAEPKPRERLTVHLPAELRQQLEREAKEDRRTLSAFVELALLERFRDKGLSLDGAHPRTNAGVSRPTGRPHAAPSD
jgi:hypothetical protein